MMLRTLNRLLFLASLTTMLNGVARGAEDLPSAARAALRKAAGFYREQVATHGGYVYFYSLDLRQRWGEGVATPDQIWVQPPGTPTVGLAFVKAYEATGDAYYRAAATAAAEALVYGQLASGGWTNCVDFNARGERVAQYRNGRGRGKNNSSLDDGQTQSALRLLMHVDKLHEFQRAEIHKAVRVATQSLLATQFPNGGFPQIWTGPVSPHPSIKASYPEYDWRTTGRIKNYWDMYTLNDNVAGYVAETLIDGLAIYHDKRLRAALQRLGDFLLLAQMPDPQPGWAQQYNYMMQPIWARKFEPPGVSGDETQEVIETLMRIHQVTGDRKYLQPIPKALAWLKRSQLGDGQLARYYELRTNRPLYMVRHGDKYTLTYDDSDLPKHYGWKTAARIDDLEKTYRRLVADGPTALSESNTPTEQTVNRIIRDLDEQGRWISVYDGERLIGQAKMPVGAKYLSSEVFSRNLTILAKFLLAAAGRSQ